MEATYSYSFSGQIIIVIHWDMNSAVQNFCYPLRGRTGFKTSPNQNHGDPMVVDVKKNDGFLLPSAVLLEKERTFLRARRTVSSNS